jgi:hypothetical protein
MGCDASIAQGLHQSSIVKSPKACETGWALADVPARCTIAPDISSPAPLLETCTVLCRWCHATCLRFHAGLSQHLSVIMLGPGRRCLKDTFARGGPVHTCNPCILNVPYVGRQSGLKLSGAQIDTIC